MVICLNISWLDLPVFSLISEKKFKVFSKKKVSWYFKNTKNLFIHIALIPEGDNPRVNPNILKCLLHSPVAKGYRLVVIASRAIVCKTPTYLILNSLAFARGVWFCAHTFSFLFCLFCLYLIIFNLNYPFWSVIITLWLLCAYFTAISGGCWPI